MKKLFKKVARRYLNEQLDFRAQLFNMLAITGIVLGTLIAISGLFTHAGAINIAANLLACLLAVALLEYATRTGRYQRCYLITVVIVFIIMFPAMFFSAGGYLSGMPSFFVFAIVFTVFMLQGKRKILMAGLELAVYIAVCLVAWYYPETVNFFDTPFDIMIDVIIGFTVAGVALSITVIRHTRIYDNEQKQLAEAVEQLRQIDRRKTELLGNLAHELRTPLTVVSGYAQTTREQLLQQYGEQARQPAEKLTLVASEAERLALMVGHTLDVARIDEGHMHIDAAACHVDSVVHQAIGTYFPILNKKGNRLDIRLDEELPPVLADPARITQVIVNLISNAVRFTSGGQITVSAAREGAFVAIGVADTGAGIPPQRLPHIFERYNSQKPGGGANTGTGLGLYICRHIVQAHGGQITVASTEGRGTSVRFTLPVA